MPLFNYRKYWKTTLIYNEDYQYHIMEYYTSTIMQQDNMEYVR